MSSADPEPIRRPAAREPWWTRAYARVEDLLAVQRRRYRWFDHLARAGGRYQRTQGDLMAAGVTVADVYDRVGFLRPGGRG